MLVFSLLDSRILGKKMERLRIKYLYRRRVLVGLNTNIEKINVLFFCSYIYIKSHCILHLLPLFFFKKNHCLLKCFFMSGTGDSSQLLGE